MPNTSFEDSVEIDNIYSVILDSFNDLGQEWLLYISTKLGWTKVETFGPLLNAESTDYISYSRYGLETNDHKIALIIDKFLLDLKRLITQVFVIDNYKEYDLKRELVWQHKL